MLYLFTYYYDFILSYLSSKCTYGISQGTYAVVWTDSSNPAPFFCCFLYHSAFQFILVFCAYKRSQISSHSTKRMVCHFLWISLWFSNRKQTFRRFVWTSSNYPKKSASPCLLYQQSQSGVRHFRPRQSAALFFGHSVFSFVVWHSSLHMPCFVILGENRTLCTWKKGIKISIEYANRWRRYHKRIRNINKNMWLHYDVLDFYWNCTKYFLRKFLF